MEKPPRMAGVASEMTAHGTRIWWYVCAVFYLWFFAHYALNSWKHPFHNWDMIAYIAVVESYSHSDPQDIYNRTLDEAATFLPLKRYHTLANENKLWPDAKALYQQLPLYQIKPLYTGAMYLLHQLGMKLHVTSYALSIAGILATAVLAFLIRPRGIDPGVWWLLVIGFFSLGRWPLRTVGGMSTPDTLCIALVLGAFCFWMYRKSAIGFGACMLLAQLARPDTMLLTVALCAVLALDKHTPHRMALKPALIIAAAAAVLYFLVNHLAGNYGWRLLYYYSFINRGPYPAEMVPIFNWQHCYIMAGRAFYYMSYQPQALTMFICSLFATVLHILYPSGKRGFVHLIWLVWLVLAARVAIFPVWWETRYYHVYYLLIFYCMGEIVAPYAQAAWAYFSRWIAKGEKAC